MKLLGLLLFLTAVTYFTHSTVITFHATKDSAFIKGVFHINDSTINMADAEITPSVNRGCCVFLFVAGLLQKLLNRLVHELTVSATFYLRHQGRHYFPHLGFRRSTGFLDGLLYNNFNFFF